MIATVNEANEQLRVNAGNVLASARAGSDAALEALIRRHEPRIHALAKAIMKEPAWAEDVVQDTLLQMLQKLPTFDGDAKAFDMWVLSIARNTAITMLRKRRVRSELAYDATFDRAEDARDTQPSPSDVVVALEDAGRLTAVIGRLPLPLREVVILRFYHDLQPLEIGRVLNENPVNVRVRLFRAIRELRTLLS